MKKLINDPEEVIEESIEGMVAAHPELIAAEFDPMFVRRAVDPAPGKVAIISGGGSGHEPLHAGYVGDGMLDAACPGNVFTSPTPDQMVEAARAVQSGGGVLFIVKNYSGDVMNFEMATELVGADGVPVQSILIDDDIAVQDSLYTQGRRGVGTTVLAEKICGAAARNGYDLGRLADLCRKVNTRGRSMGVALTSCTVPAKGEPTFEIGADEIEIGIGIHGEPGVERRKAASADELAAEVTNAILEDPEYRRVVRERRLEEDAWQETELVDAPFATGDRVLAFVNGMGGTPISELYIVYRKLAEVCNRRGIEIARSLIGSYITSLDMQGFSVTLLRMDDELLTHWDAPVNTPALRWGR